jgi:Kef-type K+ transport system membrane component KefB
MLAAAVGLFLLICRYGDALAPPAGAAAAAPATEAASAKKVDTLLHVLIALLAVVAVGRVVGSLFVRVGQPPVIGEVVAGILLGPSLLRPLGEAVFGRDLSALILPASVAPFLGVIAQLGVILYMFLVGLGLNPERLKERAHATVAVSHASIVAPFVLGAALALVLYPRLAPAGVHFRSFALFTGVALAVTAFPVLARILTDRGLSRTRLGVIALACAAADDVTAWCLLAFVVGVQQAQVGGALLSVAGTAAYILFMFAVVRPVAARLLGRLEERQVTRGVVGAVLAALLASALATEAIGTHAVFGAFLLGAVIPHESAVSRVMARKLEDLVTVLLLPAFFAFTGLRTQIGLLSGWVDWLLCGLVILAATAGKFGGTVAAARLTGVGWRDAAALGALMNTRGLMGMIVLNIGLDLGVISPTLFAMMVLMALATTMATAPALRLLGADRPPPDDQAAAVPSEAPAVATAP